jgi:hypothetical protein
MAKAKAVRSGFSVIARTLGDPYRQRVAQAGRRSSATTPMGSRRWTDTLLSAALRLADSMARPAPNLMAERDSAPKTMSSSSTSGTCANCFFPILQFRENASVSDRARPAPTQHDGRRRPFLRHGSHDSPEIWPSKSAGSAKACRKVTMRVMAPNPLEISDFSEFGPNGAAANGFHSQAAVTDCRGRDAPLPRSSLECMDGKRFQ